MAIDAEDGRPRTDDGRLLGYQPALDGVRAVAVAMVLSAHLDDQALIHALGGGWLGVDVFFVLSGYLITAGLLSEFTRHGRVNFRHFYARRLLRLAPLSVLLVVGLVVLTTIDSGSATGLELHSSGALAVIFYYANWSELSVPGSLGSLLHAWSLSIEEQFYLVWPALLIAIVAVAKNVSRTVVAGVLGIGIAAMGMARRQRWVEASGHGDPERLFHAYVNFYLNSLLRPDGLLFGAALAALLHRRELSRQSRRALGVLALAGLVVAVRILSAAAPNGLQIWIPFMPLWGLSVFNLSVTLLVGWLVVAPGSSSARFMSWRPFTWLGRRAYGVYLIHPIVLAAVVEADVVSGWTEVLAVVMGALVLSALSYRWVELPFLRMKGRFSGS